MIASPESPTKTPCEATPRPASRDHRRIIRWILFVAFLVTVPVPFYMIVVGGLIPTAVIVLMTLQGLVVAIPKISREAFVMLAILGAHVLILGGLLFLVAAVFARLLCWALSKRCALLMASILVGSLVIVSCFEIYRLPGHHWMRPANLVEVFKGCTL